MKDQEAKSHTRHADTGPSVPTDVRLVVECICAAVYKSSEWDDGSAPPNSLWTSYQREIWQSPIEAPLHEANQWSLQRYTRRARELRTSGEAVTTDLRRLISSTSCACTRSRLQSQVNSIQEYGRAYDTQPAPAQLKISRVEETEQEGRWDVYGQPHLLRRNILGEHFACIHRPLSYLRDARSANEIFQLMKPRVRQELVMRERRRIQRLNARHQASHQTQAALEAKLDRVLAQ